MSGGLDQTQQRSLGVGAVSLGGCLAGREPVAVLRYQRSVPTVVTHGAGLEHMGALDKSWLQTASGCLDTNTSLHRVWCLVFAARAVLKEPLCAFARAVFIKCARTSMNL